MITPTFKVDQDENFVIVTIHTPHVRVCTTLLVRRLVDLN